MAYLTYNKVQIFGYGNIFLGLSFIHLGHCIKHYKDTLNSRSISVAALMIFLGIAILAPERLEFVRNILVQGNWILNYIYTLLACYLMWYISQKWSHDNILGKSIIYLGRNSLVIFAFHRPVLNWVIEPILRCLKSDISYFEFLTASLISLIPLYLLLNYIMRKYFPALLGLSSHSTTE